MAFPKLTHPRVGLYGEITKAAGVASKLAPGIMPQRKSAQCRRR
jgi:hypothetical protein